ncbi:type II secretion system F family protein [Piscinibacter sp. XHJ-5]|uniref:type II secretion system F family protein n=1 Tax=Piscinibacter sp. XHJ-5 TaxID=3037797 RepID=UPI002452C527|nr:type II secretion system F family protein [Piscinibacter sp. XHJ-5]
MNSTMLLFSLLGFLAVVMALEGLFNLWASKHGSQARRIADRLAALSGDSPSDVAIERAQRSVRFQWFQSLIERGRVGERLTRWVHACGTTVSAGELLLLSAGLGTLGLLLPGLLGKPKVFGLAVGFAFAVAPWWRMSRLRNKRIKLFESQFPEALDLMCRAMRAGHAFPTAVKLVGEEVPEPLGRDFRILFDEMNYGVPANEAMSRLAQRVPLPDVSYFVVAVLIQRESGGNLAELLENISGIVRARLKLLGEVRTLSAEGRMSAQVLTALPFGVAVVVNLTNPEFMSVLWTDPTGHKMVGLALFMMMMGMLWMKNIIAIRV